MSEEVKMIGKRFGKLVVIAKGEKGLNRENRWICRCDCGNITQSISGYALRKGDTKSCGCFRNEQSSIRNSKHRLSNTRLYNIWSGMKKRCLNKKNHAFKNYGGRGISVCEEWRNSFEAFFEWAVSHGYTDELTIDRIDNNGNYEPSNCRWVTMKDQQSNKRKIMVEENGELKTVAQIAAESNVSQATIYRRLKSKGANELGQTAPA